MKKVYIAWAIDPLDESGVMDCGTYDTISEAEQAVEHRNLQLAEVETEFRPFTEIEKRMAQERQSVRQLIRIAKKHGWNIHSVFDGEEVVPCCTERSAMEVVFSVDDSTIRFYHADHAKRCMAVIVLGNSGAECLSDCSIAPGWDEAMEEYMDYCDTLE